MNRRTLVSCLALTAGSLVTGGLAAMNRGAGTQEADLLKAFRAQLLEYPAMTPDILDRLAHPVQVLNRRPGGLTFLNADGKTIALSLHEGRLRAATY